MPLSNPVEVTVLSQTVTLTDAQSKALPTTGITLVAAVPGATVWPLSAHIRMNRVADYANIDSAAEVQIRVNGQDVLAPLREEVQSGVSGLLAGGGPDGTNAFFLPFNLGSVPAAPGNVGFRSLSGLYDSDIVGFPITLHCANGSAGNFTGGNAGNSLEVEVTYRIY